MDLHIITTLRRFLSKKNRVVIISDGNTEWISDGRVNALMRICCAAQVKAPGMTLCSRQIGNVGFWF